jgi:hypothetical protein
MAVYDIGDTVKLTCVFTVAGVNTDPGVVTCTVRFPDSQRTTYTYLTDANLTKVGTGSYRCDVDPSQVGRHTVRWVGTTTAKGAEEGTFDVRATAVTA